jgi:hypothetical protein
MKQTFAVKMEKASIFLLMNTNAGQLNCKLDTAVSNNRQLSVKDSSFQNQVVFVTK